VPGGVKFTAAALQFCPSPANAPGPRRRADELDDAAQLILVEPGAVRAQTSTITPSSGKIDRFINALQTGMVGNGYFSPRYQ